MLNESIAIIISALTGEDAYKYWLIPVISAFVGWGTNWLAIQLTLWPVEYVGKRPFGWQGVVPAHAGKMASIIVSSVITKLSTLYELFQSLEPDEMAAHVKAYADKHMDDVIDDAMIEYNQLVWDNLPVFVKKRVYAYARKIAPELIDNAVLDVSENIEELVDVKTMIVDLLTENKALMNRVILEVGSKELQFVIRSGLYFGLPFGIIQMLVWILNPEAWVLPLFGFFVGYATNWLAINLLFRPLEPVKIGSHTFKGLQGLFLKRQPEIAEGFCRLASQEVLTVGQLVTSMLHGPRKDKAKTLIRKHLRPITEATIFKALIQLALGPREYVIFKNEMEKKIVGLASDVMQDEKFNEERGKVLAVEFTERLKILSPHDFQDLLRPAFKEDEWILVMIGAILGLGAGFGQLVFLFA